MLRPLTKNDIAWMSRGAGYTFKVAVVYNGKLRFINDVHEKEDVCFLDGDTTPVKISDCEYIEDYEGYKKMVDRLTGEDKESIFDELIKNGTDAAIAFGKMNEERAIKMYLKTGLVIHTPETPIVIIDPLN